MHHRSARRSLLLAGPVPVPKFLVFCSDGGPKGFNAQIPTHSRLHFRRQLRIVHNPLVDSSAAATTSSDAGRIPRRIADGEPHAFRPCKDMQFHTMAGFKPNRDFDVDDILFSFLSLC